MNQSRICYLSANLVYGLACGDSWSHAAVVLIFGAVLGIGFNSANPNGVAWCVPAPPAALTATSNSPAADTRAAAARPVDLSAAKPSNSMGWEQLAPRVAQNKAMAIDLRPAAVYEAGHVPKAVSYPLEVFGADLDSPAWQTFRAHAHLHHFIVLYGADRPTEAMQHFRSRLVDELGYAMVIFAEDGFRGWELRQTKRKALIADAESKARLRLATRSASTSAAGVPAVTYSQAAALPNALWIDSRSRAAFAAGHIPGAISIPESSEKAVFERLRAEQPAERPIVVYCSGVGCGTSRRLAARLASEYGFTRIHHLPGGFTEWQQIQAAKAAAEENSP